MVKRWLNEHPVYGVRPILQQLPIHPDDQRPDGSFEVYCDAEDECVAEEIRPDAQQSLVVLTDGDPLADIKRKLPMYEVDNLPVAVLYCLKDVPTRDGRKDGGYVLNATMDSLWALQETGKAREHKKWNDCELIAWRRMTVVRVGGMIDSAHVIGGVIAVAHMRRTVR